ncbi:signal peptidase I [Streptomyces sp. NPDC127110]|uniref:signal peptidase I n=1 Tax=Streptomyces sp. NPDC127110 TaxID=3345362 RepID=UPI00362BE55E
MGQQENVDARMAGRSLRRAAVVTISAGTAGLLLGLLHSFIGYGYAHTSMMFDDSMEPSLRRGEVFYAEAVTGSAVRHGDVVVFDPSFPNTDGNTIVARVVALGGETLAYKAGDGHVTLDGKALQESYTDHAVVSGGSDDFQVQVPEGRLVVFSDSRVIPLSQQFEPAEGGPRSGDTGTDPLTAVRFRIVGSESDPTAVMVANKAVTYGGLLLIPAGCALAFASRLVRRRAEAAVVYPWS